MFLFVFSSLFLVFINFSVPQTFHIIKSVPRLQKRLRTTTLIPCISLEEMIAIYALEKRKKEKKSSIDRSDFKGGKKTDRFISRSDWSKSMGGFIPYRRFIPVARNITPFSPARRKLTSAGQVRDRKSFNLTAVLLIMHASFSTHTCTFPRTHISSEKP